MKAADITTGEDYAIERFNSYFVRMRIESVEMVEGRSRGTGRYGLSSHGTMTKKAIARVVFSDGTLGQDLEHVVLTKVVSTWAEHLEHEARRNERAASIEDALGAVEARAAEYGVRVYFARNTSSSANISAGVGHVSASDVRKLIDAAFAAGAASVTK